MAEPVVTALLASLQKVWFLVVAGVVALSYIFTMRGDIKTLQLEVKDHRTLSEKRYDRLEAKIDRLLEK